MSKLHHYYLLILWYRCSGNYGNVKQSSLEEKPPPFLCCHHPFDQATLFKWKKEKKKNPPPFYSFSKSQTSTGGGGGNLYYKVDAMLIWKKQTNKQVESLFFTHGHCMCHFLGWYSMVTSAAGAVNFWVITAPHLPPKCTFLTQCLNPSKKKSDCCHYKAFIKHP